MFKILRILFTVLSALCVLPVIFLGIFSQIGPAVLCALAALLFFLLAALFKNLQTNGERTPDADPPGDFFEPRPAEKKDEKDEDK